MITVAICLLYYGAAVWLYQVYLLLSVGHWVPIPLLTAWRPLMGAPPDDATLLAAALRWVLDLPLSLTLVSLSLAMLASVAGVRRLRRLWARRRRRQELAEQCAQAGYTPWSVPKVLSKLEASDAPPLAEDRRRMG